jgi:site-specific recombinase XerD
VADRRLETISGNMKASSALRRQISITQLKPFFGKKTIRSLMAGDCDEWVIKRGNKISASSFNNERDTLIQILDYAKRDGLILNNPAREISRRKMGKPKIVIPTREQFKLLSWLKRSFQTLKARTRSAFPQNWVLCGMR